MGRRGEEREGGRYLLILSRSLRNIRMRVYVHVHVPLLLIDPFLPLNAQAFAI